MEPNDGNLYFIDDDTQHILLIQTTHKYTKTILKPDPAVANATNLKQLTIDLQQKLVILLEHIKTCLLLFLWLCSVSLTLLHCLAFESVLENSWYFIGFISKVKRIQEILPNDSCVPE